MITMKIAKKIKDRPVSIEGINKEYSVFIPIIEVKNELHILFEIRSSKLKVQPNEICFPGGKLEKNETHSECALRETSEELLLTYDDLELMGEIDTLVLPYNSIIHPFVGVINKDINEIKYNKDEVYKIFSVPLNFFLNTKPDEYYTHLDINTTNDFPYHLICGGKNYNWGRGNYPVYFYKYNNQIIWGITAKILRNFIEIIKTED